jgi:hypothetical protein
MSISSSQSSLSSSQGSDVNMEEVHEDPSSVAMAAATATTTKTKTNANPVLTTGATLSSPHPSTHRNTSVMPIAPHQQHQQEHQQQQEQEQQDEDEMLQEEFNPYAFIKGLPPYSQIVPPHKPRATLLPRPSHSPVRPTLVLDLDETLVHCSIDPIPNPDLTFKVDFNGVL